MKKCSTCKEYKTLEHFSRKKGEVFNSQCRQCAALASRKHYILNKDKVNQRSKRNKVKYVENSKQFILEYLSKNPCSSCGCEDIRCLDFHHTNKAEKSNNVSTLVTAGCINVLKKEVSKCVVLCANCHRIITHEENNSYKHRGVV